MTEQEQQDSTVESEAPAEADTSEATETTPVVAPEEAVAKGGDEVADGDPMIMPGMNWFVLRVASNKEKYVQTTLLKKIKIENYMHLVNRILVPTEKIKTIKNGKQKITLKMLYPGYVFVEMRLENDGRIPQDVFFLIKETTGVGDFIGTAGRPSPMSIPEIEKMQMASKPEEETPTVQMDFQKGDQIKIKDGPFENMEGTVDALLTEKGMVRVIVMIFGRATPVELEYWLIDKVDEDE